MRSPGAEPCCGHTNACDDFAANDTEDVQSQTVPLRHRQQEKCTFPTPSRHDERRWTVTGHSQQKEDSKKPQGDEYINMLYYENKQTKEN